MENLKVVEETKKLKIVEGKKENYYAEKYNAEIRPYQNKIEIDSNVLLEKYRELHNHAVRTSKLLKRMQIARDITFSGIGTLVSGTGLVMSSDYLYSALAKTPQTVSKPIGFVLSTITQSTPIISNNFDKGVAVAISTITVGASVFLLSKFVPVTFEMIRSYTSDKKELYKENEKTDKLLIGSSDLKRLVIKKTI